MDLIEASPDDLTDSLAYALLQERQALRRLGQKPPFEPGNNECHAIAVRLVAHLKRSGIEKVVRRISRSASVPPLKSSRGG
jgi:hypothetical protein